MCCMLLDHKLYDIIYNVWWMYQFTALCFKPIRVGVIEYIYLRIMHVISEWVIYQKVIIMQPTSVVSMLYYSKQAHLSHTWAFRQLKYINSTEFHKRYRALRRSRIHKKFLKEFTFTTKLAVCHSFYSHCDHRDHFTLIVFYVISLWCVHVSPLTHNRFSHFYLYASNDPGCQAAVYSSTNITKLWWYILWNSVPKIPFLIQIRQTVVPHHRWSPTAAPSVLPQGPLGWHAACPSVHRFVPEIIACTLSLGLPYLECYIIP